MFTITTATGNPYIAFLSLETDQYKVLTEGSFARYLASGHLVFLKGQELMAVSFDLEHGEVTSMALPVLDGIWTNPTFGTAHFATTPEGTLAYVSRGLAERSLVWVDRTGDVRPITEARRAYEDPRLSPDGTKLAVTIQDSGDSNRHIWTYKFGRDAFVRLTFGSDEDQSAIWTPDGKRVVFRRGVKSSLFWLPVDGSGQEERLTTSGHLQRPDSWSPDGETLVYSEERQVGDFDIWSLSPDDRLRAQPILQTPFMERSGILSPDGRLLAYVSNESGEFEVYVRPFPGPGTKWRISNDGGRQPLWARNGREIFYRNADTMMVVAIETEPAFRAGKPVLLFDGRFLYPDSTAVQYDVTSDGQNFVMVRDIEPWPTEIHVVLNWFEELEARVPAPKH